jgi:hypothetical protein
MLVLDHAGDRAERTIGDMPGDGAAELSCGDAPRDTRRVGWDDGLATGPEQRVEMVAIDIELTDDLGGNVRLCARFDDEHRPEGVGTACGGGTRRELLQHSDRFSDGFDRDPFGRLPLA